MAMETFLHTFHNLNGKTLSEKQKNFNTLLKNLPPDHDGLIAAIVPKNNFENLLKIKLLVKLQRLPELIQILKSEDEYFPAKLLKNRWFCQRLAVTFDESSEGFVNDLLPCTSYVIRKRIIAKLATFGTRLDGVFYGVCARYGIHIAAPLIVACSNEIVATICQSDERFVLAPSYQKLLYRKHPLLFAQFAKNNLADIDPSAISYVAKRNINDFLELVKERNYFNADLGKHLTRKILMHHKDLIVEQSEKFSCILHLKTVIKILSKTDFKNFFSNCFPSDFSNLKYYGHIGFNNLCTKLGSRYYQYLFEIVSEKYKKSLYDFPDLVTEEMMTSMEIEERLTWVNIKKKSTNSDEDWIPFMKTSDSIPLIKNKINVTSCIETRGDLIGQLLKTCKINKDLVALAEVCEYVASRHHNDSKDILSNFLCELKSSFELVELSERHWKAINSVCTGLYEGNPQMFFNSGYHAKLLEFWYTHKNLSDNNILDFLRCADCWLYRVEICEKLRKVLLLKRIDFTPALLQEGKTLEYQDLDVICEILDWNKNHPKEKIEVLEYPRLVSSLEKCLLIAEKNSSIDQLTGLKSVFKTFICMKQKSNLRSTITKTYFLMDITLCDTEVDFWLLKNDPDIIYTHFDKFLQHVFKWCYNIDIPLLKFIKTYTDLDFQKKVVNYCVGIIQEQGTVFKALAILESPEKFLQHIAPFYPTNGRTEKSEFAIQIAESFKYASSTLILPTLATYCKGDYLRHSLESLYYRFYHSPENQLSVLTNDLSSKAVSVRKHSIFLTCIVGSVSDVLNLLQHFVETEKNVSVLKHLCKATLQYFVKNPSDEFWNVLKVCMTKLDKNDTESLNMLMNLHRIPKKYQSLYVIFVWDILKKNEDKHRPRLLSSIPRQIFAEFPLDFLLEVISENLFKPGASCQTTINDFIVSSLIQSVHRNEICTRIFWVISNVNVAKTQTLKSEHSNREMLADFVSSIVSGLIMENSFDVLQSFSLAWNSLFTPIEMMMEHLKLCFARLYVEAEKDLTKFATSVAHFFENFVSTYNIVLVDCFASELVNSLQVFLRRYGDMGVDFFKLCLYLAKLDNNIFQLLAVKMLPEKQPSCEDSKLLLSQIVEVLRSVQQEAIQVLMNIYVTNLE